MSSLQLICHMVTAADTVPKSLKVSASVIAVCLSSRGPSSLQSGKTRPICARSRLIAALHLLHRMSLIATLLTGVTEPVKVTVMLQRSAGWTVSSCLTAQKPCRGSAMLQRSTGWTVSSCLTAQKPCAASARHHPQNNVPVAVQPSTWEQTHSSSWSRTVSLQGSTTPLQFQVHAAHCPCHMHRRQL